MAPPTKQLGSNSIYEEDPLNNSSTSSKDERIQKVIEGSVNMVYDKPAEDEDMPIEAGGSVHVTLFAAKIFSVSVSSSITYVHLHLQDSVLAMELTYR